MFRVCSWGRGRGASGANASAFALLACLASACGSESWSPTAPAPRQAAPTPIPMGELAGTVTINGEARPAVWVEAHRTNGVGSQHGTTMPSGSWEWDRVRAGNYAVDIKAPPGLSCDVTRKSVTVDPDRRTVVDFACFGEFKSSIAGFLQNEFGPMALRPVMLTGPVSAQTVSGSDGFFSFEGLPDGEYVVGPCPVRVSVRAGTTALADVDCS